MPLLKSPGMILKVWKRATNDYLKLNKITALPANEDGWAKKFAKHLETLRGLAQQRGLGKKLSPAQVATARGDCLDDLEKLRKIFKPKKTQATVKKFYLTQCQLTLTLEKLLFEELDDDESGEPSANALDGIDGEGVDQRDGAAEESAGANGEASPPPLERQPAVAGASAPPLQRQPAVAPSEPVAKAAPPPLKRQEAQRSLNPDPKQAEPKKEAEPAKASPPPLQRQPAAAAAASAPPLQRQTAGDGKQAPPLQRQPAPVQEDMQKESKRVQADIKALVPKVLAARAAGHPDAAELTELIQDAFAHLKARAFEEADECLTTVKKLLDKKFEPKGAPKPESPKEDDALLVWRSASLVATRALKKLQAEVEKTNHELAGSTAALIKTILPKIPDKLNNRKEAEALKNYLQNDSDIQDLDEIEIDGVSYGIRPKLMKALAAAQEQLPE